MKYLLIVKPRSVPPAAVLRAHKQWVLDQEKKGRLDFGYCFAAGVGGVTIVNVDTLDELNNIHFEAPAGPFCDLEVYPLVDFGRQMDRLIDSMERR